MKKQIITAFLLILNCTGFVQAMDKKLKQEILESLNKKDKRNNSRMIFYYAAKKGQNNYKAYTNKETLETITTYDDENGKTHYTIEYHNPFDPRILYNKTGFIIPHEITKEVYDKKKIEQKWDGYNEDEAAINHLIRIIDSYPIIQYIKDRSSYVKNNDTYIYRAADSKKIIAPIFWCMNSSEKIGEEGKRLFNSMAQKYNKQPIILYKKLLLERECSGFKDENKIQHDCLIKYETLETENIISCKKWIENKEKAQKLELEKQLKIKQQEEKELEEQRIREARFELSAYGPGFIGLL